MNKILASLSAVLMILGLSSCDSRQTLAKNINGSWSASPDQITIDPNSTTGVINIIDFIKAPSQAGGDLVLSSLVSVSSQVQPSDSVMVPLNMTASGMATVKGTWAAHDDDEVIIVLDPTTFTIQADPDAVVLTANTVTGETTPDMAQLKASALEMVRNQINTVVRNNMFSIQKIDDIKITDNMMSCEINHRDLTLRRQVQE